MTQTRKFPAFTTAQLKEAIAKFEAGTHPCGKAAPGHIEAMKAEIAARDAGVSKPFVTPHHDGPMVIRSIV